MTQDQRNKLIKITQQVQSLAEEMNNCYISISHCADTEWSSAVVKEQEDYEYLYSNSPQLPNLPTIGSEDNDPF